MLDKVNVKYWFIGFVLVLVSSVGAFGQQGSQSSKTGGATKTEKKESVDEKVRIIDQAGPAVYQSGKRSPFEDPKRRPTTFHQSTVRLFPSVDERLRDYMSRRSQARAGGTKAPSALSAFLVEELEVNGVFKTKEGYGAVVRAKPTNQTYFVHSGDKVFNGEIIRLEARQVVFRDITWMVNGKDVIKEVTKVIQAPTSDGAVAEVNKQ